MFTGLGSLVNCGLGEDFGDLQDFLAVIWRSFLPPPLTRQWQANVIKCRICNCPCPLPPPWPGGGKRPPRGRADGAEGVLLADGDTVRFGGQPDAGYSCFGECFC